MSIQKTMMVGRPKIDPLQKKVTWSFSIDQQLLKIIKEKAKHGKVAAWMNAALWDAVNR